MIDHEALTMNARRAGLDTRPEIQREMRAAADLVLERAWLAVVTPPKVTDAAVEARYNRQYANRPATDEVHARHILVGTEAEAKSVLEELKGGADFAYGEAFPHDANLDLIHGVDFRKGCFVGQEVVSRVEHRGTARKRIVRVHFVGPAPAPGSEIIAGEMAIGDEDVCAFFGESNRGGASDSAGAARDECVFVFKSEGHRNSISDHER